MKFIPRLIFTFFSNLVALLITANFIPGFEVSADFIRFLIASGIFTFINIFIKPVFTTILSPFIFLTLGLLSLVINAAMLYLLDVFSENVTITTIESLIYGTLLISLINLLITFSAKSLYKFRN
jgi:putative membrane protein